MKLTQPWRTKLPFFAVINGRYVIQVTRTCGIRFVRKLEPGDKVRRFDDGSMQIQRPLNTRERFAEAARAQHQDAV